MRNLTIVALAALLSIAFTDLKGQDKPVVLSTASLFHDMAKNIGGNHFVYEMIVPIGGDPHLYEPTPSDARKCTTADLILMNGLTFEGWLSKLIENSGGGAQVATITKGVVPISSLQYANAVDPHAWMDASNGLIYVQNIRDAMVALKPEAAADFNANYNTYKQQLEDLDQYISRKMQSIPEDKRILITSHDAFQYYGRRYKIRLEAIMGTSTDADVQTSDIRRLNEVIRSSTVPAVFIESTINPKQLEQIASDNGIVVGGRLFADSLDDEGKEAGTYIGMLRYNTDAIVHGLSLERSAAGTQANHGSPNGTWLWLLLLAPVVLAIIVFIVRAIQ